MGKQNVDKCQKQLDKSVANIRLCDTMVCSLEDTLGAPHALRGELELVKALLPPPKEENGDNGGSAGAAPPVQTGSIRNPFGTKNHQYKELGIKHAPEELSNEKLHKLLVKLHGKIRDTLVQLNKANCKWTQLVDDAMEMRDNIAHSEPGPRRSQQKFESDFLVPLENEVLEEGRSRLLFAWRVWIQPPALRGCAILAAALSVAILVGAAATIPYAIAIEMDFGTVKLSPVEFLISLPSNPLRRNMLLSVCIGYYAFCAMYSLFKLKIASLYELYAGATDEYTITLNTMLLMRITPPLLWFFYGIVYEAAQIQTPQMVHWQEANNVAPTPMDPNLHNVTTEFAVVMSYINVVPLLGPHFLYYIPPLLIFWSWLIWRNSMTRCLRCLRLQEYDFSEEVGDVSEQLQEGKKLLDDARQARVDSNRRMAVARRSVHESDRDSLLDPMAEVVEQSDEVATGDCVDPAPVPASPPRWHKKLLDAQTESACSMLGGSKRTKSYERPLKGRWNGSQSLARQSP